MDAKSSNKTATLTVGNKTYDFPILSGTVGPDVIDIAKLYAQAGMFTYDPGFTSTGSCQSKITYIDGDAGVLEYRGYPIEQLAEKGDFLETCYLLLYGELPTPAQKKDFDHRVIHHTMRDQLAVRADNDVGSDDAVGTDRGPLADHSAIFNPRGGIDRIHKPAQPIH